MKRYCSDHEIGAKRLEEISDAYQLFEELRKRDLLGPEKTGILVELLEKADRIDLKNKVLGTQGKPLTFTVHYLLYINFMFYCVLNILGPSSESCSSRQQPSSSGINIFRCSCH